MWEYATDFHSGCVSGRAILQDQVFGERLAALALGGPDRKVQEIIHIGPFLLRIEQDAAGCFISCRGAGEGYWHDIEGVMAVAGLRDEEAWIKRVAEDCEIDPEHLPPASWLKARRAELLRWLEAHFETLFAVLLSPEHADELMRTHRRYRDTIEQPSQEIQA